MNKPAILFLAVAALISTTPAAFAQGSYHKAEIFGGVSYLPADGNDFPRKDSPGFQASIATNLNRWFGIVGDFGGHYSGASTSVYQYMIGPRFTFRSNRASLFVHALAGGAAGRTSRPGFSDSQVAFGGGGGLDIHLNDRFAIRAFQFDYIGSFTDILEDNVRAGAGIVIKFGR